MKIIGLNISAIFLLTVVGGIVPSRASETRPALPLVERFGEATEYGVGNVEWGAVANSVRGRAQLFSYQIGFGSGDFVKICTERELYPGQVVLLAINRKVEAGNISCAPGFYYLPANHYDQVIYAGFRDLIGGKVWFKIPAGMVERFGCSDIEEIRVSSTMKFGAGGMASTPSWIDLGGHYFSGDGFFDCLKSRNLSPRRISEDSRL